MGDVDSEYDTSEDKDVAGSLTLNQAHHLTKASIVVELQKRGIEVDETQTRDLLRAKLVELVRVEISNAKSKQKRDTTNREFENTAPRTEDNTESPRNSSSDQRTSDDDEMSTESAKIFFRLNSDDWESFTERLELHFFVKKITEPEMKRAVFLTHVDEEAYKLIKTLCAPKKPVEETYENLTKLLTGHLKPAPSEVMERCMFNRAKQEQNESISEFATRLRHLALNCKYADLNVALRDQLVCGIFDESTRVELFKEAELTFEKALKEATARERAITNAAGALQSLANKTFKQENFAIDQQRKQTWQQKRDKNKRRSSGQQPNSTFCYCCGDSGHVTQSCKHRDKTCNFCNTKGHLERACIRKKKMQNKFLQDESSEAANESSDPDSITAEDNNYVDFHMIYSTANVHNCETINADPMFIDVGINGKSIKMELDTGTYFAVMSENFVRSKFPNLKITKSNTRLVTYEDNAMEPRGQLRDLEITLNNKTKSLHALNLKGNKIPLIGRQWLSAFKLWPLELFLKSDIMARHRNEINKLQTNNVRETLLREFDILFSDTPGMYNKREVKLHVNPNTKPIALRARHVPYALRSKVEEEIDRLLKIGHLIKVESSEWAPPIVPILKGNGKVRICGDFKVTLNPHLKVTKRPFPRIDDIFAGLQNGKTFSQLDLPHAYMQIPISKESRELLTITTHMGLYQYTKMMEGTSVAPSEFVQIMEESLQGTPGTVVYMDNIFVTGKTDEEHVQNLRSVCEKLTERGLRLNKDKCEFMKKRIEVLGFVIDKDGLHKAKTKVKAMYEAPRPTDTKQLSAFLGLINFYARFLENRADKLRPLYDCANKDTLEWTKECEAFWLVKNEMISDRVLAHYDPNEKLILACDASQYGIAAILSHRYKDGTERPIAYASKRILEKEMNRAINDKEAGAIVFGFIKYYFFVYGRKVILRTDHKPLETIFGPKRGIPLTAASRFQRWALFLSGFDYVIEWVKSNQNGNCDALSRLPIEDDTNVFGTDTTQIHFVSVDAKIIDYKDVVTEMKHDKVLSRILKFCIFGWPDDNKNLSEEEMRYFVRRNELSVEENCLF